MLEFSDMDFKEFNMFKKIHKREFFRRKLKSMKKNQVAILELKSYNN